MGMFTSYGHIIRSQNKITDFFMISAWASPFNKYSQNDNLFVFFLIQQRLEQKR